MTRVEVPTPLACLRWLGLMISTRHHAAHHQEFDRHFCTVSGWTAPVAEWVFSRVAGVNGRVAFAALGFVDVPLVAVAVVALAVPRAGGVQ